MSIATMQRMNEKTQKTRGFTLIEMMIYMGLLSIFLFVLTDLLVSTLDVRSESTSAFSVAMDGEFLQKRIEYDLRRSENILVPATTGTQSNSAAIIIAGTTYSYAVENGNLLLTVGSQSNQLNSDGTQVNNFVVTRIGNGTSTDTLRFSYTVSSRTHIRGEAGESTSYLFTVAGR